MDKRYYSARHKRISRSYTQKKEKSKAEGSTFILRLNICLGLAIVAVGAYQFKDGFGERMSAYLTSNTSVDTMKETASNIKGFVISAKSVGFLSYGDEFILDSEASEYINHLEENSYYNIQKKLESPNEIWQRPVDNGTVTDVFGNRNNPITGKNENHKGLDIGVPMNTEAKAVKSGVVIDKGYSDSYGNWVKYKTYDNYVIMYAHLSSVAVEKNQKIKQGQVIAYTGSTGNSTGPHLHYEIIENNEYLNPYSYYMEAEVENNNK